MNSDQFVAYLVFVYTLVAVLYVILAVLVAYAARRKDRSFSAFFWLSFFMSPLLPALVVAALPFRDDDPRHPRNKRKG
jgi:uncharacterized membrane protein